MRKRVVDLRTERPCLDIASFGRRGPEAKLTPSEVAFIARTARRVPEVMIKVSGGARTLQGVGAHFDYIGRKGLNEIETDMGEKLMERGFERDLMLDWDLDLDVLRRHTDRAIAHGRKPPKLVHNLIFSMPKGTPSDKLAAAVRAFAVNQFALNIVTRWHCTRTKAIRTSTSSSEPSASRVCGSTYAKRHFATGGNSLLRICVNRASRRTQRNARCAARREFQKQMAFFALKSATRPPTSRRSSMRIFVATAINRSRVRRPSSQPVAQ